jgi:hypothetical protein
LNFGMGSSSLNAEVSALERLQIVRGREFIVLWLELKVMHSASLGQPSQVKAARIAVLYPPKKPRRPMIRFMQLVSTLLAEAAWLRIDLLR